MGFLTARAFISAAEGRREQRRRIIATEGTETNERDDEQNLPQRARRNAEERGVRKEMLLDTKKI